MPSNKSSYNSNDDFSHVENFSTKLAFFVCQSPKPETYVPYKGLTQYIKKYLYNNKNVYE